MQATKKLVLLDEFDREYKRLQRRAAAVAKTDRSLRLSETLRKGSLAEQSSAEINWSTEPEAPRPRKQKKKTKRRLQWAQYGSRR